MSIKDVLFIIQAMAKDHFMVNNNRAHSRILYEGSPCSVLHPASARSPACVVSSNTHTHGGSKEGAVTAPVAAPNRHVYMVQTATLASGNQSQVAWNHAATGAGLLHHGGIGCTLLPSVPLRESWGSIWSNLSQLQR